MREKPQPISFNDTLKLEVGSSLLIFPARGEVGYAHNKRNYNNGHEINSMKDIIIDLYLHVRRTQGM